MLQQDQGRLIRFAGFISVISVSRLAGCDRSIVDQFEQVLSVTSDDGKFLAVLTESIELVGERCLELLARDVGELGFRDQRLGLGADKLLLEHDNARAVGFFVLELRNLIGDLLLACFHPLSVHVLSTSTLVVRTVSARLDRGFDVANAFDGDTVLIITIDVLILQFTNLVDQDTKLIRDIRHIVVAGLTPDGELLLCPSIRIGVFSHCFSV